MIPIWSGRWDSVLLNTQSEGSVGHRLSHFPLWFGDRLVEISVALFSQQAQSCGEDGIRHRRLVLSLETASLGHLEITVSLADSPFAFAHGHGRGSGNRAFGTPFR